MLGRESNHAEKFKLLIQKEENKREKNFPSHVPSVFISGECCSGVFNSFIHQRIPVTGSGSRLRYDN